MADPRNTPDKQDIPATLVFSDDQKGPSYFLEDSYTLEVIEGPHKGLHIELDQEITVIGRQPYLKVPITNDRGVSGYHCEIILEEEGPRVRDLGSRNGIHINQVKVLDAILQPDQLLRVGKTVLRLQHKRQRKEIQANHTDASGQLVGKSAEMKRLFSLLARLGKIDIPVLLLGETGTGKSSVARALHAQGQRKDGPFVEVNCGALPENLIESLMFGHKKGAFTGADTDAQGYFVQANGGTLFLDEIGELPLDLQRTLLSAVEEKRIRPLGSTKEIPVDFRLICATNRDLKQAVQEKQFRSDLYYRIAVSELQMPSLRQRAADIPLLAEKILQKIDPDQQRTLSPAALKSLQKHNWPGNVRELGNVLERAQLFMEGDVLEPEHLLLHDPLNDETQDPDTSQNAQDSQDPLAAVYQDTELMPLKKAVAQTERLFIAKALEQANGNVAEAARSLDISRGWLYVRMEKYGFTPPRKQDND